MQSLSSSLPEATGSSVRTLLPFDLLAAFARVPDPRRPHGRRFPLAAILANHLSVLAIAQWGKRQSPASSLPPSASPLASRSIKQRCNASFAHSIRSRSPPSSPSTLHLHHPRSARCVAAKESPSTARRSADALPASTSQSAQSIYLVRCCMTRHRPCPDAARPYGGKGGSRTDRRANVGRPPRLRGTCRDRRCALL